MHKCDNVGIRIRLAFQQRSGDGIFAAIYVCWGGLCLKEYREEDRLHRRLLERIIQNYRDKHYRFGETVYRWDVYPRNIILSISSLGKAFKNRTRWFYIDRRLGCCD